MVIPWLASSRHAVGQAGQAAGQQDFAGPRMLQPRGDTTAPSAFALQLSSPRREFDLNVVLTDSKIWNPASGRFDKVRLRGYAGEGVDIEAPFVAPQIEVKPGQAVTITLHNRLPADPTCTAHEQMPNMPHCFNGTNLHAHGLWVSPAGNGDNVLLSINPGVDFTYLYDVPPDHPSGTFWYHSHRHGSTALQVSSGMAGPLIVRGDRAPTVDETGDIDVILRNADLSPMEERVLVLQQIQYACRDAQGHLKVEKDAQGKIVAWQCDPGDVGGVDAYDDGVVPLFGPGTWNQSGRFTTINGLVRPIFHSRAGQIERWRLIHGGVRDTITFGFRRRKPDAPSAAGLDAQAGARYVSENCTGDLVPYQQIAADGLTLGRAHAATLSTLQPGYRYDALVAFPQEGDYCVVNESAPAAGSVSREPATRQLLGIVEVAPGTPVTDAAALTRDQLATVAARVLPAGVREKVVGEIRDGLAFTSFVPHPDIADSELTGTQALVFFIDFAGGAAFEVGDKAIDPATFDPSQFKPRPYDPERIDRHLRLGGTDEWTLQSGFVSHPFHIHVNPFQIVSILDPRGRDVSSPSVADDAGGAVDPQYAGLKGVWKDTLWVKNLIANPADFPSKLATSMYTIKVRTRYQRFIGSFVLHCHILDHEDQGMMQNVEIEIPDGAGGLSSNRH